MRKDPTPLIKVSLRKPLGIIRNYEANLGMRNEPGFSSSIDVRDKGDHHEVHALLPSSDVSGVKVTAESNNLIKVAMSQSKQEKTDRLSSA